MDTDTKEIAYLSAQGDPAGLAGRTNLTGTSCLALAPTSLRDPPKICRRSIQRPPKTCVQAVHPCRISLLALGNQEDSYPHLTPHNHYARLHMVLSHMER